MQIDLRGFIDQFYSDQELSIDGVGIGISMGSISEDKIDSSDPDVKYPRAYRDNKMFRILEDDSEEELTPAQRYQEVEQYGGWLRTGDISWYVKDQIIQRYTTRGDQLLNFELASENKIQNVYGKPDCKLMSRFGIEYYYLHKQLAIVWSRKKGTLDSIRVGDFKLRTEEDDLIKGVLYISGIREVGLSKIEQRHTYEGLLEGRPTKRMNDGIIERALVSAREASYSSVHLIDPPRAKPELKRPYPFGEPENLPSIMCVGEFKSINPTMDEDADGSSLTVVWFQDNFAMPIDQNVRRSIESLKWDELAKDTYY